MFYLVCQSLWILDESNECDKISLDGVEHEWPKYSMKEGELFVCKSQYFDY